MRAIQIQAVWRGYDARRLALELSDCLKKETSLLKIVWPLTDKFQTLFASFLEFSCFLAILGLICFTMLISVCWDLSHEENDISDQILQLNNPHPYSDGILAMVGH